MQKQNNLELEVQVANPTGVEIDKQRDLCRVERKNGKYGGYNKDILTENLTERDYALLVCEICEGIMREACLSNNGERFCSCCEVKTPKPKRYRLFRKPSIRFRSHSIQSPNIAVRKMINSLKCSCPLSGRGCEWLGTINDCEYHLDMCGYVSDKCLNCGTVLQRNELNIYEEEKCPQCTVKCEHCNEEFSFGELTIHLGKCPKMKVSCKLKCGAVIYLEDMAQHLEHECDLVEETCELGCGTKLTRSEVKVHVTEACIQRVILCEHCFGNFKFCDMSMHLEKCPKMKVSCELNCGKVIRREDVTQHLQQECGLVEETCELGCGMQITRDKLKMHMTGTCVQRELLCEHCEELMKVYDMTTHHKECLKMTVSCELNCGMDMCREDVTQHLNQECGLVVEACNLGCGMELTRNELKIHVTETCVQRELLCEYCEELMKVYDMTTHHKECPKMTVSCELNCGMDMCREDVTQHIREKCPEEEIACPFAKYKCDVVMKRKRLDKHLKESRTEHIELKLNVLENIVAMQSNEIDALYSINTTTKFDWYIEDISEFIQINHPPIQKQVAGFGVNITFGKQSIFASFEDKQESFQTTIAAKFMIRLFSRTKMRVIKQYKNDDISQFRTDVEQEIACIPNSDIREFFQIGATENIFLEMYITIL